MDPDLQFLVHFFNDREHLFKTITMSDTSQVEAICDQSASQKWWFWGRYAPTERKAYLARRLFVEKQLYDGYTQAYGCLKERVPVYFYIYPGITLEEVLEKSRQRTQHEEIQPHVLVVRIQDIPATSNLTFTLNDSMYSYWKKAVEAGLEIRGDPAEHVVLPDHNQVFPFSRLEQIHQKYKAQRISYEVQVWDYQLLEKLRFTILGNIQKATLKNVD